jgi:hypothetical protein
MAGRKPAPPRPLWKCPACRRTFANTRQTHSCGTVRSLAEHFAGKPPAVRALFDRVLEVVSACGPVQILPEKTRIAFHVRMSFMVLVVQRSALRGHFVFGRLRRHSRFTKIATYSPRNHVHEFRIAAPSDVDDTFRSWVAEAYEVGRQRHLHRGGR